jgi:cell volume regulation protein A
MTLEQMYHALLIGGAVVLASIAATRLATRAGLPSLLLFLAVGVAVGEDGLGLIFDDVNLARDLGTAALAIILVEGGLTTRFGEIRQVLAPAAVLATLGVAVSMVVTAAGAHLLLGMDWQLALLLGAVVSSTDAAAVFSVLRVVPLPKRLTGALEAESGLNDAPTIVLVTLISTGALAEHGLLWNAGLVAYELLGGLALGLVVGFAGSWVMRRAALPSTGLYPLAVMALCFIAYSGTAELHASGFAAVYVAGLVLGNSELPHGAATRSFAEGLAWLAQIGLFVMLGLLMSGRHIGLETIGYAVVAGLVLTLVARPVSVVVSALVQPMPARELAFISWAGLRGAVPIVLATIPLAEGSADAERLFELVFVLVVIYTLVTGPTLPLVAKVLRVARRSEPRGLDIEAAPLERVAADLLQVTIAPTSKMHGVEVGELRLPPGSSVSMIVRDGETLVPERRTVLKVGDDLLVVAPRKQRQKTEERLRQVSARGRLAQWLR